MSEAEFIGQAEKADSEESGDTHTPRITDVEQTAERSDSSQALPAAASIVIDWDGPKDPENPMNFSRARKWYITMILSTFNVATTFSSSVFSPAVAPTARYFGVSDEVMVLGTSLFLAGLILGPFVFGFVLRLFP